MSTIGNTALTTLQVAALRMPCLFAAAGGTLLVGEGVYRGVTRILNFFGFTGESEFIKKLNSFVPEKTGDVFRPYKKLTDKELAVSAAAACTVGIIGTALVGKLFGPAPAVYNQVLTWLGPIRINDATHPLIAMAARKAGF